MAADAERAPAGRWSWVILVAAVLLLILAAGLSEWLMRYDSPQPLFTGESSLETEPVLQPPPAASDLSPRQRSAQQLYLAGVIFFQKGDYEKAGRDWRKAARLDPGNEDVQAGLRRLRRQAGKETP